MDRELTCRSNSATDPTLAVAQGLLVATVADLTTPDHDLALAATTDVTSAGLALQLTAQQVELVTLQPLTLPTVALPELPQQETSKTAPPTRTK